MKKIQNYRTTCQVFARKTFEGATLEDIRNAIAGGRRVFCVRTGMVNKPHYRLVIRDDQVCIHLDRYHDDKYPELGEAYDRFETSWTIAIEDRPI